MITVILILIIISLASMLLIMRYKHIKMLDRLDNMLDSATEQLFGIGIYRKQTVKNRNENVPVLIRRENLVCTN